MIPENHSTIIEAIAAAGLGEPDVIHDGHIHRFTSPDDKRGSDNCWYVSHRTAGAFGSWKLGFTQTWSDGKASNNAELLKEIREYQRQHAADTEIVRKDAATEARRLWQSAVESINHQYPEAKQITPYGARQLINLLLAPMYYRGKLVNIQKIFPDGKKRFMKGGRVTGCYLPLGDLSDHIHICEGYATGCSLHEHTGKSVAVAFSAGNLKPAALAIWEKYPRSKITVAADNDWETEQKTGTNPGLVKGRAAAAAVGGDLIYPDFSDEPFDSEGLSDWNDYLNRGGKL